MEVYMNLIKRGLLVMACSAAAGFSQSAVATNAAVSLDWSKLQMSVTGIDGVVPTVTFFDQYTGLSSSTLIPNQMNESNSASIYNWKSTGDTDAQAGTTYANALASPMIFSGSVQATESFGDIFWQPVQASSSGSRTGSFFIDAPGALTVSIPYTISITGGEPYDYFNSASATVSGSASFNGYGENGSFNSSSNASFSLNSYSGLSSQSQSGNLVFGIFAGGPGSGALGFNFNLSALAPISSVSPVPELQSYAMLLAGLGLMGVIIRRRTINSIELIVPAWEPLNNSSVARVASKMEKL